MKKFEKVQVRMLKDALGQDVGENGVAHAQKKYGKGQVYSVGPSLAKGFLDEKLCEVVVAAKAPAAPGAGAPGAPPAPSSENKDAGPSKAPSGKVK